MASLYSENVLEKLASFQRDGLFCDTIFLTKEGDKIYCHGVVLAAVCPTLQTLLNQPSLRKFEINIVDFSAYSSSVVEEFISFLYSGQYKTSDSNSNYLKDLLQSMGLTLTENYNESYAVSTLPDGLKCESVDVDEGLSDLVDSGDKLTQSPADVASPRKNSARNSRSRCKLSQNESSPDTRASKEHVKCDQIKVSNNEKNSCRPIETSCVKLVPSSVSNDNAQVIQTSIKSTRKKTRKCSESRNRKLKKENDKEEVIRDISPSSDINSLVLSAVDSNQPSALKSRKPAKQVITKSKQVKKVKCDECSEVFTTARQLNFHKWSHLKRDDGNYECKTCGKAYDCIDKIRKHVRNHAFLDKSKDRYMCPICGQCFNRAMRLQSHVNTHSNLRPNMCDKCGLSFNDAEYLVKHQMYHTGTKRYECEYCQKKFYLKQHMVEHQRMHTGEKPYECKECGSRFTSATTLKFHIQGHNDIRPHTCNVCQKSFIRRSRLNLHVRNMHSDSSARPFVCSVCGKTFVISSYLTQHMQVHELVKPKRRTTTTAKKGSVSQPGMAVGFLDEISSFVDVEAS